jgi:hypothetical protein
MVDAHVTSRHMPAMKPVGERSAGNPHAAFDERGGETDRTCGTAPLLDSTTGEGANRRRYGENGRAEVCGEGWVAHDFHAHKNIRLGEIFRPPDFLPGRPISATVRPMSDQMPTLRGRPAYQPTAKERAMVTAMAAHGLAQEEIAAVMECCPVTLRRRYRLDLDRGMTLANAKVARNLFEIATGKGPGSAKAAIFWLACRAQWSAAS